MTTGSQSLPSISRGAAAGSLDLLPDPEFPAIVCPIISVDDHLLEPPHVFDRVPRRLRDAVPRQVLDDNGRPNWLIDGEARPISGMDGAVGRPPEQWRVRALAYDEFRPGVHDPVARLHDMDSVGVWASLGFPSGTWGFAGTTFVRMRDQKAGRAAQASYNDWVLEEWCATAPDRYIPCQLPWLGDPMVSAADIYRNADRGFHAVSFSENPSALGLPSIYTRYWDPFFEACAATGTVINLHVGSSGQISRPSPESPEPVWVALFPINAIQTVVDWIFAKIPVRFPDLKIVLSEGGASWVPMAIERLERADRQRDATEAWRESLTPREVFARNFWFASIEDPAAFRLLDVVGEYRTMIEVDYPHGDSSWPATQQIVKDTIAVQISRRALERVCYANAAELYQHPMPSPEFEEDLFRNLGGDAQQ